jgi:signal transduction histidine kinase/CheY-like chemotaxis protein
MWYVLRTASRSDADFVSSATQVLHATARMLLVAIAVTFLCWHFFSVATWPAERYWQSWVVLLILGPASLLCLWMIPRWFLAAQSLWLLALTAAITLAMYVLQEPFVAFLYALIPLIAVVTIGWPGGLFAQAVVVATAVWFTAGPGMPLLLVPVATSVVAGGLICALLGWAATHALITVVQWSLFSFEQAREVLEEARDQRLELKEVQRDLIRANAELARLTDRLTVLQQVADEARRAKEDFVAKVSHELRTPLNMIIGFSEMITASPKVYGSDLPPTLLTDVAAIQRNSEHLARLVDDVLDLSQVEAGRMAVTKEWGSLPEIVGDAALAVRALFEAKGLALEVQMAPDLPPVFCDTTRIREVLINLLSNAGRFTDRGGVTVQAWIDGQEVVVSVTDTGAGIRLEDQTRVFEPFQQADSSIRRRQGGTGLGLSISKRFVEMHEGRMWLESELDVGTTVFFTLPLRHPGSAEGAFEGWQRWFNPYDPYEYRMRSGRSKAPPPEIVPRLVLLEKGRALQRLLVRYFGDVELVCVPDIESACSELERSPAQALIVNAASYAQGSAIADKLSALPYGTPAFVCSIAGEESASQDLGIHRYLVKPVTRDTLLDALGGLGSEIGSVLLVDDQIEVLQLFSRMLASSERGYRLVRAKSGKRALQLLRQRKPDVMILDLFMPGMDGFQVLQAKQQDPEIRDIPVVVVSAQDPVGQPIVSSGLQVVRGEGLSISDLMACIHTLSQLLSPAGRPDRALSETSVA